MGGVCCKDGVDKNEDNIGGLPGPAETASAPAPAPDKASVQASGASEPVIELGKKPESQPVVKEFPTETRTALVPIPQPTAAANTIDAAQVILRNGAQNTAPGDAVEVQQTSTIRVDEVATSAAPAVPPTVSPTAVNSATFQTTTPASGTAPPLADAAGTTGLETKLKHHFPPSPQPELESQPQARSAPQTEFHLQSLGVTEAPLPIRSQILTDSVQASESGPRTSAAMLHVASTGAKATADTVALLAHRMTEAGLSVTRNSSVTTTQPEMETAVTDAADEEPARVKVETSRRTNNQPGGGIPGDGSSSVSYSHSATSSQQPGSSLQQQGSNNPTEPTPMMMESSAQAPSAAGSSNQASNPSAGGSKGADSGFMFGAPRAREHKNERKTRKTGAKPSKSQSSGSNASGAQPPPGGSEAISGSKASGSDAMVGGIGGSGIRALGSSNQDVTMMGSSAADPSLSSMDTIGMSTPPVGAAGTGSLSMGPSGGNTDFSSVNRRIGKVSRNPAPDGSGARPNSRVRSNTSSLNAASSSAAGGGAMEATGATFGSTGEPLVATGVPEVVPEVEGEGEGEGEAEDGEGGGNGSDSSRRSSSEHLSIMSPPEGSDVENVLMLICNIFQLPVALVAAYRSANIFIRSTALRLTDDDQWRYSLAQWSMLNAYELRDVLLVPNATLDERFREYYCVKNEPKVKFFMASPLRGSSGELLGTLCMADFQERNLEPTNLLVVNNLQTLVIRQLERDMALAQERVENEVAKVKLQQEMMRALDHFEKCIMFVDTSKPGWEVLYTNLAWEHVTGIPREHVLGSVMSDSFLDESRVPRVHVMGRPLQDYFMALGGAALDWSSTTDEVASRSEFTVHRVAVRQKPDKLVSLHLRLATEEATGELEGLLPKGLPGWVKARGNEAHNYFVFVEEVNPQAGTSSTVYEALAKHVEKVPGLELSHLLGKGGFGSVYYGTWNGMPVAVKMIDNKLTKTNTEGVSLEALMGQELAHPNIVKTIKYVMRTTLNASSVSGSTSRINSARPVGLHSRNRDGLGPYSGGIINSRHGSRNVLLPAVGSSGANPGANGANGGAAAHPTTGMMSYVTSAQPGLSGMTSAQMAAAADLTSASGMQHLNRMGTTMTSDATTVAGGGSAYSNQLPYGSSAVDASGGMLPREATLAAAAAAGATEAGQGSNHPGTTATSTTTSGLTAVGPASVQASSTSTAAGPPSVASAGGVPANQTCISTTASSRPQSATAPVADRLSSQRTALAAARARVSDSLSQSVRNDNSKPLPVEAALPEQLPPLVTPAAGTSSITAAYPPNAPPPDMQNLTAEQQQAAMTSRFSLAFSSITSGGDVLVPGKGSRSPSTSSDGKTQLTHNVNSVGSAEDMGEVWIIMEFCDRGSLQDALDRGALKLRKAGGEMGETHLPMMISTACEVASALHYLHDKGIVHGDLTAWNVMLCTAQDGQQDRSGRNFVAKVADFGLSRTLDVKSKIKTRTYGTISHMPPECLISGIISKATDVFAFGVLLWQMYTGLRPWAGMNHGQIIYNVGMKNVQLLFPPGTPPAIADLSSSCTRTNPAQRPSFNEILDKLDNIRASLGL
ncbi:hypothetical protein VaNZ11_005250 [Volvox africanus]|uniref:Protein kinase domain-containing protein n=1 Tax=Volvox africanus TaxID=51714 RepID=A0ABQ5RYU8_9CHLO|nr:hypothetical protein VaNZ11_005250 [Volvox africanus]